MLWDIFDGDKENLNIAYGCIDRHVDKGTAIKIKFADGHTERIASFNADPCLFLPKFLRIYEP